MSKLIKRTNGRYDLYYSDDINQLNTIASTQYELNVSKLSVKNCESIKNGYDLDELAKDYANGKSSSDVFKNAHEKDFIAGFKKALEIIGDKKFSKEDIKKMMKSASYGWFEADFDKHLATLQQTEWDVEIEMDTITTDDLSSIIGKPKFDSDGCLILKRK
jgi:hypothetical protein